MNQYVDDKFNKDPRIQRIVGKGPETGGELMKEIATHADGVFLWVMLVIRNLLGEIHTGDNVINLQESHILPTELDSLFQHILFDTQSEDRVKEASRIFQLVRAREIVCDFMRDQSTSSLTLWELALAYCECDDDLALWLPIQQVSYGDASSRCRDVAGHRLSRCAGLLEIHRKNPATAARTRFSEEDSATSTHTLAQSRVIYLHRTVRDFLIYSGV
jgi:hypothetical protein